METAASSGSRGPQVLLYGPRRTLLSSPYLLCGPSTLLYSADPLAPRTLFSSWFERAGPPCPDYPGPRGVSRPRVA